MSEAMTTTSKKCLYCGLIHEYVCPMVRAIEYHPDGTVKRVEFKTAAGYPAAPPVYPPPPPFVAQHSQWFTTTCVSPVAGSHAVSEVQDMSGTPLNHPRDMARH